MITLSENLDFRQIYIYNLRIPNAYIQICYISYRIIVVFYVYYIYIC